MWILFVDIDMSKMFFYEIAFDLLSSHFEIYYKKYVHCTVCGSY